MCSGDSCVPPGDGCGVGWYLCPESLGGGCCQDGYTCTKKHCVRDGVAGNPDREDGEEESTTVSISDDPTPISVDSSTGADESPTLIETTTLTEPTTSTEIATPSIRNSSPLPTSARPSTGIEESRGGCEHEQASFSSFVLGIVAWIIYFLA